MSLLDTLNNDLKEAMKAKDMDKLSVLRMVITDIKNTKIQKMHDLSDEEVLEVISRQIKQRNDAIEQFKQGGRDDLAQKEEKEKTLLTPYLPAQMTEEEINAIIEKAVAESGASGAADFGNVAKLVMPQVKGKADSKQVSDLIKAKLQ